MLWQGGPSATQVPHVVHQGSVAHVPACASNTTPDHQAADNQRCDVPCWTGVYVGYQQPASQPPHLGELYGSFSISYIHFDFELCFK